MQKTTRLTHLVVGSWASWTVLVARELVKQGLVVLVRNRAVETTRDDRLDVVVEQVGDRSDLLQWKVGEVWDTCLSSGGEEASSVATIWGTILEVKEVAKVHGTTGEVGK